MASRRLPQLALVLFACGPATPTSSGTSPDPYAEQAGDGPPGAALAGDEGEPAAAVEPAGPGPEPAAAAPAAGGTAKPEGPPILAAHNRMRARHCAPPLTWSAELVKESQRWARNLAAHRCAFEHNPDPRYGENLAYFRPPGALGPDEVAEQWYREIEKFNFKKPGFSMEAGHFTQMVWVGSKRLGCASVECGGGELWVCNYDPPGNMQGDFGDNVRREGCK